MSRRRCKAAICANQLAAAAVSTEGFIASGDLTETQEAEAVCASTFVTTNNAFGFPLIVSVFFLVARVVPFFCLLLYRQFQIPHGYSQVFTDRAGGLQILSVNLV